MRFIWRNSLGVVGVTTLPFLAYPRDLTKKLDKVRLGKEGQLRGDGLLGLV